MREGEDITELLTNELGFVGKAGEKKGGGRKPTVTYHDPCHLNRAQGIRQGAEGAFGECAGR